MEKRETSYSRLTEAQKEHRRAKARERWHALTPEQRIEKGKRRAAQYAAWPEERKEAHRAKNRKAAYADYENRLANTRKRRGIKNATGERRGGPCAICRREFDVLDLDHDKRTGLVRGWLCRCCNMGLGKFQHDPVALERAAVYIRNSLDQPAAAE